MCEEDSFSVSTQRRCAQICQQRRLSKLQAMCPCGVSDWPCECSEISSDPYWLRAWNDEVLKSEPIFFDEGKHAR
jgi:hypothetical protein